MKKGEKGENCRGETRKRRRRKKKIIVAEGKGRSYGMKEMTDGIWMLFRGGKGEGKIL